MRRLILALSTTASAFACSPASIETSTSNAAISVDGGAHPSASHLLYVNFNGATVGASPTFDPRKGQPSTDDGSKLVSAVFHGQMLPTTSDQLDEATRARILDHVRKFFAEFDVEIVSEPPAEGRERTLVVVGNRGPDLAFANPDVGVHPPHGIGAWDCKNKGAHEGTAAVFLDQVIPYFRGEAPAPVSGQTWPEYVGRAATPDDVENAVAVEIAHEASHTLGLAHVDEPHSIMNGDVANIVATGEPTFLAGLWIDKAAYAQCATDDDVPSTNPWAEGYRIQNLEKRLLRALGPKKK